MTIYPLREWHIAPGQPRSYVRAILATWKNDKMLSWQAKKRDTMHPIPHNSLTFCSCIFPSHRTTNSKQLLKNGGCVNAISISRRTNESFHWNSPHSWGFNTIWKNELRELRDTEFLLYKLLNVGNQSRQE